MTKFLIIVAVCALIGGIVVQADRREMFKTVMQCAKEFAITKDGLKDLEGKKLEDINPSENLKCHTRCVLQKTGVLEDDKLNEEKIIQIQADHGKDAATAQASIDACKENFKGAGTCDEAWDLFTCFFKRAVQ